MKISNFHSRVFFRFSIMYLFILLFFRRLKFHCSDNFCSGGRCCVVIHTRNLLPSEEKMEIKTAVKQAVPEMHIQQIVEL